MPPHRIRRIAHRARRSALAEFLKTEAGGSAVLLAAAIGAMVWANVAFEHYDSFWNRSLGAVSLHVFVNEALMSVFFFVVGLEIKRELVTGELRDKRAAALPVIAAVGGMVGPAAVYLVLNGGGSFSSGWGVPVATDIAFALGVVSLLGSRVPASARLFLLALAIADDIGAMAVIAIFFGGGLHPAVIGVLLGLLVPARPIGGRAVLENLEQRLHPLTSFAIVPLFALANAGVVIDGAAIAGASRSTVFWGIGLGLVAGKTLGISVATFVAVALKAGRLPAGMHSHHVVGVAAVAGIGFTVSLFITDLAFRSDGIADTARLGVLAGSVLAALGGATFLAVTARRNSR